jgi:hypothetical protein
MGRERVHAQIGLVAYDDLGRRIEHAQTLGHVVDGVVEILVLRFERQRLVSRRVPLGPGGGGRAGSQARPQRQAAGHEPIHADNYA